MDFGAKDLEKLVEMGGVQFNMFVKIFWKLFVINFVNTGTCFKSHASKYDNLDLICTQNPGILQKCHVFWLFQFGASWDLLDPSDVAN